MKREDVKKVNKVIKMYKNRIIFLSKEQKRLANLLNSKKLNQYDLTVVRQDYDITTEVLTRLKFELEDFVIKAMRWHSTSKAAERIAKKSGFETVEGFIEHWEDVNKGRENDGILRETTERTGDKMFDLAYDVPDRLMKKAANISNRAQFTYADTSGFSASAFLTEDEIGRHR